MATALELTGKRFGRLEVLHLTEERGPRGGRMWQCLCDCGGSKAVLASSLNRGLTSSCGCLYNETRKTCHSKHNKSNTREYNSWSAMKQRCYNPKTDYYHCYGGRGITVCDEWLSSFSRFLEDMGECPEGMSIERIDNEKGYSKGNCKWETASRQGFNTRLHSNNTSSKTGVCWHKVTSKWMASIRADGLPIYLGVFNSFEAAVAAREAAELKYYGRVKDW